MPSDFFENYIFIHFYTYTRCQSVRLIFIFLIDFYFIKGNAMLILLKNLPCITFVYNYLLASSTATAHATVIPTMGLLPTDQTWINQNFGHFLLKIRQKGNLNNHHKILHAHFIKKLPIFIITHRILARIIKGIALKINLRNISIPSESTTSSF